MNREMSGESNPMFGRKRPDLVARNKANCGEAHHFYGKKRPEHAEKMRGKRHSEETRRKQSEGVKRAIAKNPERNLFIRDNPAKHSEVRKLLSERKKGENNFWFGKKNLAQSERMKKDNPMYKEETKQKHFEKTPRREESHLWQGGRSFEPYGIEFDDKLKEQIRERDNHACRIPSCGAIQNGQRFPIHHIDYDKRNNDPSNLILLCISHHNKTTAGNREYWTGYFQELQVEGNLL